MVARLPSMPAADFEAILDNLDEHRRRRVLALLSELGGAPSPSQHPDPAPCPGADALPQGLSPWLLERLGVPAADGAGPTAAEPMTPHALDALRRCAVEAEPKVQEPARGESLLGKLWQALRVMVVRRSQFG